MQTFSTKAAIKAGWTDFKSHKGLLIGATLVTGLISGIQNSLNKPHSPVGPAVFVVLVFLWVLSIVNQIGWYKMALKIIAGEQSSIKELFSHWGLFWDFIVVHLWILWKAIVWVVPMLVVGGLFIIGVPFAPVLLPIGIAISVIGSWIVFLRYSFAALYMIEKGVTPRQAIEQSASLTEGIRTKIFWALILLVLVVIAGAIVFGVGLLVSIPVSVLAYVHIYRALSGQGLTPESPRV